MGQRSKYFWKVLPAVATLLFFQGCTTDGEETPVPISLRACSTALTAESRSVVSPGDGFPSTLVASDVPENFTATRWVETVTIQATSGNVNFTSGTSPLYPENGEWIYLTGISPQAVPQSGIAEYTLDGVTDVMYAKPVRGNKWDGDRFAGNTIAGSDKPLEFGHLLTQLQITAKKELTDQGIPVRIEGISVKSVTDRLFVSLVDGTSRFEGNSTIVIPSGAISGDEITGSETESPTITSLLLPPKESDGYILDITTSIGTFNGIEVKIISGTADADKGFRAGYAHRVTLTIRDKELGISVDVSQWKSEITSGGDIDLME